MAVALLHDPLFQGIGLTLFYFATFNTNLNVTDFLPSAEILHNFYLAQQ